MPKAAPVSTARLAARAVALAEHLTPAERKELLDAIGVLDRRGRYREPAWSTAMDSKRQHSAVMGNNRRTSFQRAERVNRDRLNLPQGLRNLPDPHKIAS